MDLVEAIRLAKTKGNAPVIGEIKRIIPQLGEETGRARDRRGAGSLSEAYQKGGVCGISVVTETRYFGGQPEIDIPAVLRETDRALLVKDFILDESMVDFYADLVSSLGNHYRRRVALLLTAHWLGDRLPSLLDHVHGKGMLALVETREPEDLSYAINLKVTPKLIGINNKDIDELERGEDRIKLTSEFIDSYRRLIPDSLIISQSAHKGPGDVRSSIGSGADAVLVGTAFMVSEEPVKTVASFVNAVGSGK